MKLAQRWYLQRLIRDVKRGRGRPSKSLSLRAALVIEHLLKEGARQEKLRTLWDEGRKQEFEEQLLLRLGFAGHRGRPMTPKHFRDRILNPAKKVNAEQLIDIDLWDRWQSGSALSSSEQRRIERELLSEP